jgi:tetratricopeptide (TPR) repeat protein
MADWLDRLDVELENVSVAIEWGLEAAPEAALRMCDAMFLYWRLRIATPADVEAWMLRAIEIARSMATGPPEPTPAQLGLAGRLLGHLAVLWGMTGRPADAASWARDGLAFARASGDRSAILVALQAQVYVTVFSGSEAEARPLSDEIFVLAREEEDWDTIAVASGMMAAGMARLDPRAAEPLAARAASVASRVRNPFTIAAVALGLGRMYAGMGRPEEARAQLQLAIDRLMELGDERLVLAARSELGHAFRRAGRFDEAEAVYREAIMGWLRLGNRGALANILEQSAFMAIDRGDMSGAARLLGAAEAIREIARAHMSIDESAEHRSFVERLRSLASEDVVSGAWRAGRILTLVEAVEFVAPP